MWNFRDLIVWEKSIQLCDNIYKTVSTFPKEELYWLTSQIKRSSISIPSNIAEWYDRNSSKDFIRFLLISKGSCAELETQLILSSKLGFIDNQILEKIIYSIVEIRKMISWLISKINENE